LAALGFTMPDDSSCLGGKVYLPPDPFSVTLTISSLCFFIQGGVDELTGAVLADETILMG